jgi:hypothetical protein
VNYYRALAFHLRTRNLPEERIAEILTEVQDVANQSGQPAEAEFGRPSELAESYPKLARTTSLGGWVGGPLMLAALCVLLYRLKTGADIGPLEVTGALVAMALAAVLGMLIDCRLPAAFTRARRERT